MQVFVVVAEEDGSRHLVGTTTDAWAAWEMMRLDALERLAALDYEEFDDVENAPVSKLCQVLASTYGVHLKRFTMNVPEGEGD